MRKPHLIPAQIVIGLMIGLIVGLALGAWGYRKEMQWARARAAPTSHAR